MMTLTNGGLLVISILIGGLAFYGALVNMRNRRIERVRNATRMVHSLHEGNRFTHLTYPCGVSGPAVARDIRGAHSSMQILENALMNHYDECDDCQLKVGA